MDTTAKGFNLMTDQERDLRLRVNQAKAKLPRRFMPLVFHFYPQLDEPEGKTELNRLKETSMLRSLDEQSVRRLEYVAENYKSAI